MRSYGWKNWIPLAIFLGAAAIAAGWLAHSRRQPRARGPWPPPTPEFAPPVAPQSRSASLTDVIPSIATPPTPPPPAAGDSDASNRSRERAHVLSWFVSIVTILNLAGRVLEASQEAVFTQLIALLDASSIVVLSGGLVFLAARWRSLPIWPRWLWRFCGLGVAALMALTAAQAQLSRDQSGGDLVPDDSTVDSGRERCPGCGVAAP